jgi:ABC-type polysaccharide/polyol phosphate transport system ATPase subunit
MKNKKSNRAIAINLEHVSKKYEIHHEKPTLVEKFVKRRNETFWALKDINLIVYKGEKLGIIGHNGSGKTTLLKIISGITTPTTGIVNTNGKVVSLIDLEAGFHLDLTGVQNIYLSGLLLGISKQKIDASLLDIIEFADIKQFIDAPVFTYSQGMILRLGFAIAVHADPDIFILDENIAVGDENFQKKSAKKIGEFFAGGKTIVIVSQWKEYIKKNCTRVIELKEGALFK